MTDDGGGATVLPWQGFLPWQRAAAVDALAGRATWPHALLVAGPRGIGKRTLALEFARSLLCEAPAADGLACGACASCGYVAAGQHPDLQVVEPFTVDDDGEVKALDAIPVDRIRALIDWALLSGHRGRAKVAVVVPAEALNAAAANALLKTLEEPPAGTFLLLVSHQPGRVPATLRSRCRRFPAPQPDGDAALHWLEAQGVPDPAAVLAQAGGAPLLARLLADPAAQDERRQWLAALAKPKALSPVALAARLEAAPKDERKLRLGWALDWLGAWTADLARVAAGGTPARNPDFASALSALAPAVAPAALFRYHRSVLRQRALVAHPLQPRLVAETMLIGYRELFR
ncbi:MAG: DNA polymerase III subunit delta' [Betaproteobacteria bacterium]|nr:DNA polymerase III subunit delta' [Betaproteobacteria bacterium]MCC7216767.1 DNA polymerase III subunit delta' [Burkholderiales bacterium]